MNLTANEIAQKVDGNILGDGETKLTGFAKADAATTGDLTFAENEKFFAWPSKAKRVPSLRRLNSSRNPRQ